MEGYISYTEQELAEMTVLNHFLLKAFQDVLMGSVGAFADLVKPGSADSVMMKIPQLLEQRFLFHLTSDPKVDEALQDKLRLEIKDFLG